VGRGWGRSGDWTARVPCNPQLFFGVGSASSVNQGLIPHVGSSPFQLWYMYSISRVWTVLASSPTGLPARVAEARVWCWTTTRFDLRILAGSGRVDEGVSATW
jgi:hypothetical protein